MAEVAGRLLPATLLVRRLSAEGGPVEALVEFDPRLGEDHRRRGSDAAATNLVCEWGALAVVAGLRRRTSPSSPAARHR